MLLRCNCTVFWRWKDCCWFARAWRWVCKWARGGGERSVEARKMLSTYEKRRL